VWHCRWRKEQVSFLASCFSFACVSDCCVCAFFNLKAFYVVLFFNGRNGRKRERELVDDGSRRLSLQPRSAARVSRVVVACEG